MATKLYIPPPRPGIVLRPRLIERLDNGLAKGRRLTLISASAGFGKTTLVSEWITHCGRSVAWLSLDEGDNDSTRFLTYLIAALQTLAENIGARVLGALQSPQLPPIESILTTLLNEITTIPDNFVLVLDDYHIIDSKPVDNALTFLLEHLPPQMHLVIATREDPQLPLSRLRARGQLTELRATDLRFTPSEAAEFLNQMMGLNLSTENIAALEARTEGWIAGLQLAALSMQGSKDVSGFIQEFAGDHRYIVDYLVEEVLQRQPKHVRNFLLQTAILNQLNGSLCDAVTGKEDGNVQLEVLQRGNFFVIPLDDKRNWYRYHHLFADVLRMHLMAEQPDQVSALHRRASEWYEQNGLRSDAIRHALAAEDFERAATLVELAVPEMRRNRQGATVKELGWLKALPDELIRFRPVLCVDYAYALFAGGELGAVEARLRDAERWLDTTGGTRERPEAPAVGMVVVDEEEFRRLPSMIALLRAAHALARGDMPETAKNARRVLNLAPEDAHLMLGGAASQLGLVAWASGDLDTAFRMTADGMANVRRAGYISSAIGCSIVLADVQIAQGCLHEAMTTYERALQWAMEPGAPVLRGAADMYVGMSTLHYEHNDLKAATQCLLKSQSMGDLAGLPQNPYRWRAAMARMRQAQGDLDGAIQLLEEAERVYDGNFSPNVRPVATRKVRVWLAQGRLGEALGWARQQGLSVENDLSYLHEFDHITLARVLLARYQSDRADGSISGVVGLLERLLKAAEEGGRKGSVVEILVLQAFAYHAQGDLPAALLPLQHALALAEPEGYVRMFLDEGSSMIQLLREVSAREIMPDYTDKLLAGFEAEKRKGEDKPALPSANLLIDPLSQRELKILQLIAQGLSNREIGERLFLALDTIKGHNRKIFDKLQVQSRTEAIARARELGLL
ncbi:MAG: LuxR C-terminal-related transcriptional regulator [Anaerolineales bacterium]|nr:MAG: LuxR C-terminal-related transcriptional regulator [Anaerolineales bacterium]